MSAVDLPTVSLQDWESAVAFRLFADQDVPTLTVPEQIAARVGERILSGLWRPGERIGEQELADEFQVSRGPIREALRILEREGLVTLLARRGAVVTRLQARELHELLETWLPRLAPDGTAWLVVQKHLGADSLQRWLEERFPGFDVERATSKKTYRIIAVTAPSED